MENNQKIQENNIESNVNNNNSSKKEKSKTVILIIILMVLIFVFGIGVGFVVINKGNGDSNNSVSTTENKGNSNASSNEKKENSSTTTNEKKDDNKVTTNENKDNNSASVNEKKADTQETQKTSNENSKNQATTNNEYTTAVNEIKKCLKDRNWLKQNIYISEDENSIGGDISDQIINFIVCKGNSKPIVLVQAQSDNARFTKIILVTYIDGNVKAEIINQGHIYHGYYTVDANKCVVCTTYMHQGDNATILHSVLDGSVKFLGEYGHCENYNSETGAMLMDYYIVKNSISDKAEKVSEEEYESYAESLNIKQYNFVTVGTELTDKNVDTYIK
ncbi:MAG: hypothetical protein IKD76_04930 [Clostridia bacterium]|nr:hypothetical protein [Clostridia bacterium]